MGQEETDDFLFINPLIYCLNIQKIARMGIQMLFACYFFGAYWYVYSETMMIYIAENIKNGDLDI